MSIIATIVFVLAVLFGLAGWLGLISPKLFKDKKTGEIPKRSALFFGGNVAALVLAAIAAVIYPAEEQSDTHAESTAQTTESTTQTAANDAQETEQGISLAESKQADFDFDFNTYRTKLNSRFTALDLPYTISNNVKPSGGADVVNQVANYSFSDGLSMIASVTPATQHVNSVTALIAPGGKKSEEVLQYLMASSLIIAAANNSDTNKQLETKVLKMLMGAVKKFTTDNEEVQDSFVENNVKYSLMITPNMPIMLFATPQE